MRIINSEVNYNSLESLCLKEYFEKGYVVKDDQMIIIDCVVNNLEKFQLHREQGPKDNWFMFQRILIHL